MYLLYIQVISLLICIYCHLQAISLLYAYALYSALVSEMVAGEGEVRGKGR